jgi:hypothetical protein
MSIFEDKNLVIRTRILDETEGRVIQEIAFIGIHDHHWPVGWKIQEFVEGEIRKVDPAAYLFDFLEYEYEFGNEIGCPIMATLRARGAPPFPPIAIVAQGGTARSMKSLFAGFNLKKITEIEFFEDSASGCAFLHRTLDARKKPPAPEG